MKMVTKAWLCLTSTPTRVLVLTMNGSFCRKSQQLLNGFNRPCCSLLVTLIRAQTFNSGLARLFWPRPLRQLECCCRGSLCDGPKGIDDLKEALQDGFAAEFARLLAD